MMSSVSLKLTPGLRSTRARSGTAARSSARMSLSDPFMARPMGVRIASTMTASGMAPPARKGWRRDRRVGHADAYGEGHARLLTLAFGADRAVRSTRHAGRELEPGRSPPAEGQG